MFLSEERKQQVIALRTAGKALRRIQGEIQIRRETAAAFLKAPGIAVRSTGWLGSPRTGTIGHRGDYRLGRRVSRALSFKVAGT